MTALRNVGVSELVRIAGEAILITYCGQEGVVERAYFIPRAPIRGFERLVKGKNPLFVIEAVKRICGFCHSAHGIAAAEAFEDAFGIYPPKDGLVLREIIGLLNRVQSHLAHLILIAPDFVRAEELNRLFIDALKVLEKVNSALARIGGAPTHPPNIVIGGVAKAPSKANISSVAQALKEVRAWIAEVSEDLADEDRWVWKAKILSEKRVNYGVLATHPTYGDKYSIDLSRVSLRRYDEIHQGADNPPEVKDATSLVALYGGEPVEVGPRARMEVFRGFRGRRLTDVQLARLLDTLESIDRILTLLKEVNVKAPTRVEAVVFKKGEGVGVYEAPRGTLIHKVKLGRNGRVESYSIIVPTEFLIPVMESCATGLPVKVADAVPRVFDPCMPCTTHVIRVASNG